MPLVSIIIPVYNCEDYIQICLDSILNQTFNNFEIILINDGSTDSTSQLLEKYKEKVKLINISNHGQAYARNLGINNSNGDYICFVDSDDYLEPEYIEKLYKTAITYNSDMSYCFINRFFDYKPSFLEKIFSFDQYYDIDNPFDLEKHKELLINMTVAPFGKLIKRNFILENKVKFVNGKIYEDLLFTSTLLLNNPKLSLVPEKLYNYRMRKNSTMSNKNSKIHDIFFIFDSLYEYCSAYDKLGTYKSEIDFLMIYHIGIGTTYRLFFAKPLKFIQSIKTCSTYLKKHHVSINNKYFKEQPLYIKLFIKFIYSNLH